MIATVLDTGPLAAALNTSDRRHTECASLLVSHDRDSGHRWLRTLIADTLTAITSAPAPQ